MITIDDFVGDIYRNDLFKKFSKESESNSPTEPQKPLQNINGLDKEFYQDLILENDEA